MAVTINWYPPHPAPTGLTATLADGGNLLPNTTYYYTVIAVGTAGSSVGYRREGAAATEVSITTSSTQKTVNISWDAVSGCAGYYVYRRKSTQPDYTFYGAQLGGYGGYTTTNTSYTDDGTGSGYWNRMLALTTATGYPGNFDIHRGRGYLEVEADASGGTVTIQDLHDAIADTNFSEYDERTWNLLGTLEFKGWGPITFEPSYQNINFLGNFYQQNLSSSSVFTFSHCMITIYSHSDLRPAFEKTLTTFNNCKVVHRRQQTGPSSPYTWMVRNPNSIALNKCDFSAARFQIYNSDAVISGTYFNEFSTYTPSDTTYSLAGDFKANSLDLLTGKISYLKGINVYSTDYSIRLAVGSDYYVNLVNAYFPNVGDLPIMWWYGSWAGGDPEAPRSYCCCKYEYDLTVKDRNGNPISGATVVIKDVDGNEVSNVETDANGQIITQNLKWVTLERNDVAGQNKKGSAYTKYTYHTPHTVIISKSGYITKIVKYTMDREREEVEVLEKVKNYNFSKRSRVINQ